MTFLLYKATSKTSGSSYIGVTGRALRLRRRQHELACAYFQRGKSFDRERGCPAFVRAMAKYGTDDFLWEVIADGLSRDEVSQLERFCIDLWKPRYNISPGGYDKGNARSKRVVCLDGRVFSSIEHAAAQLGLGRDDVSRMCRSGYFPTDKFYLAFEGEHPKPNKAKISHKRLSVRPTRWTSEMRQKLSLSALSRPENHPTRAMVDKASEMRRRPVRCVETTTIFPDASSAGLAHGLAMSAVRTLIYTGGKSRNALVSFEYVQDVGMTP